MAAERRRLSPAGLSVRICPGVFRVWFPRMVDSLPPGFEIKIEITEACQARCGFCHQGFGLRSNPAVMPPGEVEAWIRWAANEGIPIVRFTGGEPTLHPGLPEFVRQAKEAGLKVILNTNGLGPFARIERLLPHVDLLKLGLPGCDADRLDRMTGVPGALERKTDVLQRACEAGMTVDVLTVMVPDNLGRVETFIDMLAPYSGVTWSPLRVEPSPLDPRPITREQIQALARELLWVGTEAGRPRLRLGLATPFCAVDPIELGAAVLSGRAEDCGPFQSLSVDVGSHVMRCYSQREPVAVPEEGSRPALTKLREAAGREDPLPRRCLACGYLERCRGGCRCPLALEERDGEWCDYLMPV